MARVKDKSIKTYSQGKLNGMEIWVDKDTGVNYVFAYSGYAGGLTVRVDAQGKPVVTPPSEIE